MSDFGVFESAVDAEQAPRRRERIAARQMSAALAEIHHKFGGFIANASDSLGFEDRWLMSKKDILRILQANQVGAYPAVVREVHGSLKSAWYNKHAFDDDDDTDETKPPKDDKDRDWTITDKQRDKVEKGEKTDKDDVESNKVRDARRRYAGEDNFEEEAGDTEDSDFTGGGDSGSDKPGGKEGRRRRADFSDHEDQAHPNQNLQPGREVSDALLVPDAYNDPSNPETSGVQNDFSPGGDTGTDGHREAMQLVADLYTDWAQGNRLRVASMNTLDVYAANGLHDDDYYLLAKLIRRAECDCDDDDKDDKDSDSGPPPSKDSDDDDSGDSESDDSGDDSDSDDSDSGDSESDSGDNPFAEDSGGEEAPSDDARDSAPPAEDDGFGQGPPPGDPSASGDEVPPSDDGGAPEGIGDGTTPAGPPGADVGGQDFTVPEEAPPLPPDMQEQIPQDDTQGDQAIPPEVIDQILGLPPGTLEQLVMEELSGGGGAPPSGPPPGPPQQLARRRRAAEDPTQAVGADPAAAAQPQMPAAPPAGAGSAGTIPPPGSASVTPPPPAMPLENQPAEDALLDTALQSITQMIDQETQEYQQIIDPLTQALQAVEFAQQVETAENPLDVTPPEGTVNADPSAAPGGADSLNKAARKMARTARINSIARQYKLSKRAKYLMYEAMSRKHYEHVGEAIRTLPPELRPGIANHIGGMFKEDNPRFNHDKWMESVGAPRVASRRPFVIRSTFGRQRAAGENLKNTPTLDAFEFPGHGDQKDTPSITDNMGINDLPKMKGASAAREAKDVLKKWDDWSKVQTDKGLNVGGDAEIDQFADATKVGPRALDKLKTTISANRAASFFNRRVPGWKWDDHLAGYVSKDARVFTCSCGEQLPVPEYSMCRCGKVWNSYGVGDGNHLASNTADFFIAREIPVRDDVIVANRKLADDRGYENFDAYGKGDTEWVEDKDREDADAPHAPGQTARKQACYPGCHEDEEHSKKFHDKDKDDEKTAGLNDAMSLYERHFNTGLALGLDQNSAHERAVQNAQQAHQRWQPPPPMTDVTHQHGDRLCDNPSCAPGGGGGSSLKDQVRQHLLDKMGAKVTDESDGWIKYDEDDPSRQGGPKKPPSTSLKGGDPKWHQRHETGQFKSTSPFKG